MERRVLLRDGRTAEIVPPPPELVGLYACLPHLQLAVVDGELQGIDLEWDVAPASAEASP